MGRTKSGRVGDDVLLYKAYNLLLRQYQRCPKGRDRDNIKGWLQDFHSSSVCSSVSSAVGGDASPRVRKSPNSVMRHTARTKVEMIRESPHEQIVKARKEGDALLSPREQALRLFLFTIRS